MRKFTLALSAVCLLFTLNQPAQALVSSPSQLNPGTNVAKLAEQAPIHWVSVAQIENSLTGRRRWRSGLISMTLSSFPAQASGAVKNVFSGQ